MKKCRKSKKINHLRNQSQKKRPTVKKVDPFCQFLIFLIFAFGCFFRRNIVRNWASEFHTHKRKHVAIIQHGKCVVAKALEFLFQLQTAFRISGNLLICQRCNMFFRNVIILQPRAACQRQSYFRPKYKGHLADWIILLRTGKRHVHHLCSTHHNIQFDSRRTHAPCEETSCQKNRRTPAKSTPKNDQP